MNGSHLDALKEKARLENLLEAAGEEINLLLDIREQFELCCPPGIEALDPVWAAIGVYDGAMVPKPAGGETK